MISSESMYKHGSQGHAWCFDVDLEVKVLEWCDEDLSDCMVGYYNFHHVLAFLFPLKFHVHSISQLI